MKKINVLITAGATIELIDPVRYISNFSSGKQGYKIAESFIEQGCNVTLISGMVKIDAPKKANLIKIESAQQMLDACLDNLPCDIFIACAAVCDWKPVSQAKNKLKKVKGQDTLIIEFEKNPDILNQISNHKTQRPKVVIGFAAETNNLIENAKTKLVNKGCDAIFANDVSNGGVFNKDKTHLHLIEKLSNTDLGKQSKEDSANYVVKTALKLL